MAILTAVENAFERVTARFTAEGVTVPNYFGWNTPEKQPVQGASARRICWVPGDPSGSAVAGIEAPKTDAKVFPRSLATLVEVVRVYIFAANKALPELDQAQYNATRLLFDAWYRAMYLECRGTFAVKSVLWETSKKERRHGACLVVTLHMQAPVTDEPYEDDPLVEDLTSGDVSATVTVSELDHDDVLEVEPEPPEEDP